MARASEKGGSLHTGGAISLITRKERMIYFINFVKYLFLFCDKQFLEIRLYLCYLQKKELGRPVAVEEMFKVTHDKKSTNPNEEERWIEQRAQETDVRTLFKLIFFSLSCIY